jgi:hypothetical protein
MSPALRLCLQWSCVQGAVELLLGGAARDVADPEPWLEATTLIEAMHARVFSTALKEDVVTIPGPGCCKCSVDDGASMALTSKLGVRDHIFEEAVPPSGSQEIWRSNKHAGCNNLRIYGGYEDRNALVGQHFQPNLLRSRYRLRAGAYLCDSKKLEQGNKVGSLSKPDIGHLNTEL